MAAVLSVPRPELKKLAEANVTLSSAATDLINIVNQVNDPELQRQMVGVIKSIATVAETVNQTVRSAVNPDGT